jgi:enoyl-[acyl-carrier protein] reductase I
MGTNGHGLLEGKKGVIFGALNDQSLAWHIAEAVYREGGRFILSNAPIVSRAGTLEHLAEKTESSIIWADGTDSEQIADLFSHVQDSIGNIDFIVHSIGMGMNVRKNKDYDELNYEWFHKTLDISAMSLHRIVRAALDREMINRGGSIIALSYLGAQRTFSKYSEMGDAKALLESIVRSLGYRLGQLGIRINSISQSPTATTAGHGIAGFDSMFEFAQQIAPLGNADAASCADYTVSMLSDLSRMVTMQTLYHDGGFSTMGVSDQLIETLESALTTSSSTSSSYGRSQGLWCLMIRLFVTDIDGCLAAPYRPFDHAPLSRLASYNAESQGASWDAPYSGVPIPISICSGRSYPYVEAMTQVLGLHVPVLFGAGAGLFRPDRATCEQHPAFRAETATSVKQLILFLEELVQGRPLQIDYAKDSQAGLVGTDPDQISWALGKIRAHVADNFPDFRAYSTPVSVDVVPAHLNKRAGLEWLCSDLGLKMSEIAFIGDTDGDIEALKSVGRSYAPANALEAVKSVAHVVTRSSLAEGVLEAYEDILALNSRA